MKGDKVVVEDYHLRAAETLVAALCDRVREKPGRFAMSVAGESGSGKSETAVAISQTLAAAGIASIVLGQDDYYVLPPKSNDRKRREDPEWLGPQCELRFDLLQSNLDDARAGASSIVKPSIDYDADAVSTENVTLNGVKVVIFEGTYVSLLKGLDARVFNVRTWHETLEHRVKRNRGSEVGDPFVEATLGIEHRIIAGHRFLADFLITRDYDVVSAP
jgi:uridine kinase